MPKVGQVGPSWGPKPALEGVWQVRSARAAQAVQDGAAAGPSWRPWTPLPDPLRKLGLSRVQASFSVNNTLQTACWASWRASRRPETVLSNGPSVFVTFDLELKLAKCGMQACGGLKIGLVSSAAGRSADLLVKMSVSPRRNTQFSRYGARRARRVVARKSSLE